MKKILAGLIIFCLSGTVSYSASNYTYTPQNAQTNFSQTVQFDDNIPFAQYLKYYNIDSEKINAEFINLTSSEEKNFLKTITKEEKENYKYAKKIQKLVKKGNWKNIFKKYPNYLPAYLQYYNTCLSNEQYEQALQTLNQIKNFDPEYKIFPEDLIDYSYGVLYYNTGNYATALNYFKKLESNGDDFILASIANCYFYTGNYENAINYCKKLSQLEYQDIELLFGSYYELKNYKEANKYALELLKNNYSYDNLMKVQLTTTDANIKLSYCYKARNSANNDAEFITVNKIIVQLEQQKLEKKISKLTQFVKVAKWTDIEKQLPNNVSLQEISEKQDNFFTTANLYLSKYSGQQLTNAFNSLNQDYNNYILNKQNQYYQEKQLEAQQALVEEQRINNILQRRILEEQIESNYLENQRLYYLRTRN